MNAVEREPVETRVLNPTASEASYKPKQRSYRKINLKKKVLPPDSPGAEMSSAETAALNRRHRNVPDPKVSIPNFGIVWIIVQRGLRGALNWAPIRPSLSDSKCKILQSRVFIFIIMETVSLINIIYNCRLFLTEYNNSPPCFELHGSPKKKLKQK